LWDSQIWATWTFHIHSPSISEKMSEITMTSGDERQKGVCLGWGIVGRDMRGTEGRA
jgi:hypothetical protein